MRIYLSMNDPGDASYTWISDIATFASQVLDNEATHIVLDRFLCAFTHNELAPLIEQIVKKMRLNSELVIIENDMDFLSQKVTRGEMDIGEINDVMFKNPFIKSVCTAENIESNLPSNVQVYHKNFDIPLAEVAIKCRRTS